jgi:SPP1 gp7 family putative phage head morphogenesis protein
LLFKELARLYLDGYVSGMTESRRETVRISSEIGDSETAKDAMRGGGVISVPLRVEQQITEAARIEAQDWCREIESRCQKVLLNWQGSGQYDPAQVGRQLGATVRDYLEEIPEGGQFAARRRMKVRDKEQYREWQKTRLPHVKYIKEKLVPDVLEGAQKRAKDKSLSDEERRAARELAHRLRMKTDTGYRVKQQYQNTRLRTGWNRWYNRGVVERAQAIENVIYLQWTTRRDVKVCEVCQSYDLLTVSKDDEKVATLSPPLHFRCRCRWLHVTKEWAEKEGIEPSDEWPTEQPAPGFGRVPGEGPATEESQAEKEGGGQGSKAPQAEFHKEGDALQDYFEESKKLNSKAAESGWAQEVAEGPGRDRIAEWTGGKYKEINRRIESGAPSEKDLQLLDIMSRAPEVTNQIAYRGVRQSTTAQSVDEAMASNVTDMLTMRWGRRVGTELRWNGLASATLDPAIAGNFGDKVVFEIRVKTARWIGARGTVADEDELLMMPGSRLRVVGVQRGKILGEQEDVHDRIVVQLEQL